MQQLFRLLLSPMAFAIGFIWPLATQTIIAMEIIPAGWMAIAVGAAIAIPLGIMAQVRGSWIWIRQ